MSITYVILFTYCALVALILYFVPNKIILPRIELYEVSLVTVPSNEQAVCYRHELSFIDFIRIKHLIKNQLISGNNPGKLVLGKDL